MPKARKTPSPDPKAKKPLLPNPKPFLHRLSPPLKIRINSAARRLALSCAPPLMHNSISSPQTGPQNLLILPRRPASEPFLLIQPMRLAILGALLYILDLLFPALSRLRGDVCRVHFVDFDKLRGRRERVR